jgi:aldose 1-epimerase
MPAPTTYKLENSNGTNVIILDYGLAITAYNISVNGLFRNLVLGFSDPEFYMSDAYMEKNPYLGNIVGRYANRIKGGSFELNGTTYYLPKNNVTNTLHGGMNGFNRKWWTYISEQSNDLQAVFTYSSPDGEEGFPGQLDITAIYRLGEDNSLSIEYKIYAHADSVVNLTEHSYFNLNGSDSLINDHSIQANVTAFLEQASDLCPNGKLISIADFSKNIVNPTKLGTFLPDGIDTTFVIDKMDDEIIHAGTIVSGDAILQLQVWTDAPCLHIYSGAMLPRLKEPKGLSLEPFRGVCMECQGFTDAVHHSHFQSTLIKANETQYRNIMYRPQVKA